MSLPLRVLLRGLQYTPFVVHKLVEWTVAKKIANPDTDILRGDWKKAIKALPKRE
jgi:hypothetical protein